MRSVMRKRHRHYTADVLDYVTSLGIEPERPWRPVVPDIVQMAQEGMHRRGPWSGGRRTVSPTRTIPPLTLPP